MRLFFKHLLRSIVKRPLQPIVLVFTMMLSVAVSIMALGLGEYATKETQMLQLAQYGNSDVAVSLSSTSQSRFMFTDQLRDVLGDDSKVAGIYEFPMLMNESGDTAIGVAVDFYEINNIFSFDFVQYGDVSTSNVSDVAMISKNFAESRELSLGDDLTVSLFGGERQYTVGAISKEQFMGSCDIMVDISGIVRLLAADSVLISAIGTDFKPCSTMYVDLPAGADTRACAELLKANPIFEQNIVEVVADFSESQANLGSLGHVIDIAILLSSILTIAVTFCCFYILAAERTEENAVFKVAGFKSRSLDLMQYAEIILYCIVGSALGMAFSVLLLKFMVAYAGFVYVKASFDIVHAMLSTAILITVCIITVTIFVLSSKVKRKAKKQNSEVLNSVIVSILPLSLLIVLFVIPCSKSFSVAVACIMTLLLALFFVSPVLLKWVMKRICSVTDKSDESSSGFVKPSLKYAAKNLSSVKVLHNFSRLVALLTAIVVFSMLILLSIPGFVEVKLNTYSGDYLIMNSTESCYNKVRECESVERVNKLYVSGESNFVSVEDISAFSDEIDIDTLPKGNEVVLSYPQAMSRDAKVGEDIIIEFEEKELKLRVIDIVQTSSNFILFDCEHFGASYNMLLVDGKDDISSSKLRQEIVESTALEFAAMASVDSLFETKLHTVEFYAKSGYVLLFTLIIFSMIAMIDNLGQSYRSRKEEFELYRYSGMSASTVKRMKFFEVLWALLFGILLGLTISVIGAFVIQRGLLTVKYDTFRNFFALFK